MGKKKDARKALARVLNHPDEPLAGVPAEPPPSPVAPHTSVEVPRSLAISEQGIRTGRDFANVMSSLMSDIIAGRVPPGVGNAACNAGGKLLKIVEMQHKYGTKGTSGGKELNLALDSSVALD